jgi:Polysaccharide lyase
MVHPRRLANLTASLAAIALILLAPAAGAASARPSHAPHGGHAAARALRHEKQGRRHARRRHARVRLRRGVGGHSTTAKGMVGQATAVASASKTSSGLLFEGAGVEDFWVDHSAPGAISEVPNPLGGGEGVLEMTVHNDDVYPVTPTENPRAELISPDIIEPGDEFWLSTKFMIPENMPDVSGWLSLVSVYGAPFEGASPWRIGICSNDNLCWQRNGTYRYDIPWEEPLVKGSWVNVLTHERFGSDGWVEMWIDGQPITFFDGGSNNPNHVAATQRLEMQTMDASNGAGPNSAKIMQYREAGMFETASVYFGSLKLGATRAAVGS